MRVQVLRTLSLSTALCLGLGSGAAVFAQDASSNPPMQDQGAPMRHGPMSPDKELQHMTKALNLSSDQQSQIKPILQDRHDQMMQIHQDTSMSRSDKMGKMKSLDDDSNAKVEAVLNDQQKAKYEKMIERRQAHMHGGMNNGGQGAGTGGDAQPQ